jgi:hypothetical protein
LYLGSDTLLSAVGSKEIIDAVLKISARPPSKNDGNPISVVTAKNYISTLKDFLDEMTKTEASPGSEIPLWRKPLKFDEIFRQNAPAPTAVERTKLLIHEETEADAYTVEELTTIYKAANDRERLWIAVGLNFGLTQLEVGSINSLEIVCLDTPTPYLRRLRGKTDIFARWPFWEETADLLRLHIGLARRLDPELPLIVSAGG